MYRKLPQKYLKMSKLNMGYFAISQIQNVSAFQHHGYYSCWVTNII